ncbi:polyprenyl synthetase family protein [Nocardia brasiliensis]|uniref:polyprenyl synthetase family protein n=1 Tax=Nocardia brasiliensis TaxID=37326 RepID=UPI002458BF7A|nr:polyprenyl synthetase family protein [Nocardia brasiliensis]
MHDSQRLRAEIDLSLLQTHQPVAWSVFGQNAASLAADALRAVAINELTDRAGLKILARTIARLRVRPTHGAVFEPLRPIELAECLRMIEQTTAALLSCACEIGAATAGGDAAQRILLAQFGCHLGMACQLTDDIVGIWGRTDTPCAPHYSDLATRKMTPPIVAALTSESPFAAELRDLYGAGGRDPATLATVAHLAELTGARAWAEAEADNQWAAAMSCLSGLPPDTDAEELRLLSIWARQRRCAGRRTVWIDQQEI